MTIFALNEAHHKNLSGSIIPLVHNVAQNTVTSDDNIASILDFVDENFLEVEFSDSVNEIGDNLITKVTHQTVNKVIGKRLQLLVGGVIRNGSENLATGCPPMA
jgi:hypothetical protein